MDFAINTSTPSLSHLVEGHTTKAVKQNQPLPISSLGARLEGQVLPFSAKQTIEAMTQQQLNQYLDTSAFSESESQAMMGLFLASVAHEEPEAAKQETVKDLLSFDPSAWEKHIGVLVAAIVALNIARQASAEMSGKFTQMAHAAAKAQGLAIMKTGEAAMWAAVGGAALTTTMAIGGAGMSMRGQSQKHDDIKNNKVAADRFDASAAEQGAVMKARPADGVASAPKQVTGTNAQGEQVTINLQQGNGKLDGADKTVLEKQIRETVTKAKEARMASLLNEKTWSRNLTIGGFISALAMVSGSAVTSIMRWQEFAERRNEVLHQDEQQQNKAVTDAANQSLGELIALIGKMLEAMQQLYQSRDSTLNTIASARA